MKHLMILNTLPFLPTYNENHIVKWEGGGVKTPISLL